MLSEVKTRAARERTQAIDTSTKREVDCERVMAKPGNCRSGRATPVLRTSLRFAGQSDARNLHDIRPRGVTVPIARKVGRPLQDAPARSALQRSPFVPAHWWKEVS